MIKNFINWLVTSSADSSKISLTVKSFLVGVGLLITYAVNLGLVHVGFLPAEYNQFVDAVIQIIQSTATVITSLAFVYGFVRKLWLTFVPQA